MYMYTYLCEDLRLIDLGVLLTGCTGARPDQRYGVPLLTLHGLLKQHAIPTRQLARRPLLAHATGATLCVTI